MATIYRIQAYSPSLNQTQTQVDLANLIPESMTLAEANTLAASFAAVKNRNFDMHTCDWQPVVIQESVGMSTFTGR